MKHFWNPEETVAYRAATEKEVKAVVRAVASLAAGPPSGFRLWPMAGASPRSRNARASGLAWQRHRIGERCPPRAWAAGGRVRTGAPDSPTRSHVYRPAARSTLGMPDQENAS